MSELFDRICQAAAQGRYGISLHANERLSERRILQWQVVSGLRDARLLIERPDNDPNPVIETEQLLPDGTTIKAVWAWIEADRATKLVTVHYLD